MDRFSPDNEHSPEDPLDLALVQRDDALLDRLAAGDVDPLDYAADRELIAVLASWRREVDDQPYGAIIDTDAALAAIRTGRTATRHSRFLVPFASAAAVLAIAFTGVGIAAKDAKPGDALWGLTKVLYLDHAHSVEAASAVQSDLNSARTALTQGKIEMARSALASAQTVLPQVAADDGRALLASAHASLVQQLDTKSPQPGSKSSTNDPTQTTTTSTTPPTSTSTATPPTSTPPTSSSSSGPPTSSGSTSPTATTDGSSRRSASASSSAPTSPN